MRIPSAAKELRAITVAKEAAMAASVEKEKQRLQDEMSARLKDAKGQLNKKIFEGASDVDLIGEYERKRQALNMPSKVCLPSRLRNYYLQLNPRRELTLTPEPSPLFLPNPPPQPPLHSLLHANPNLNRHSTLYYTQTPTSTAAPPFTTPEPPTSTATPPFTTPEPRLLSLPRTAHDTTLDYNPLLAPAHQAPTIGGSGGRRVSTSMGASAGGPSRDPSSGSAAAGRRSSRARGVSFAKGTAAVDAKPKAPFVPPKESAGFKVRCSE